MPERWRQLRVGDRVRLVCVPESDRRQREHELRDGVEMPGWTADTLERILALDPVVTISKIDEYEAPWFEYELTAADGTAEHHYISIRDDDSWEPINDA